MTTDQLKSALSEIHTILTKAMLAGNSSPAIESAEEKINDLENRVYQEGVQTSV